MEIYSKGKLHAYSNDHRLSGLIAYRKNRDGSNLAHPTFSMLEHVVDIFEISGVTQST
jgi:hypothetical protein